MTQFVVLQAAVNLTPWVCPDSAIISAMATQRQTQVSARLSRKCWRSILISYGRVVEKMQKVPLSNYINVFSSHNSLSRAYFWHKTAVLQWNYPNIVAKLLPKLSIDWQNTHASKPKPIQRHLASLVISHRSQSLTPVSDLFTPHWHGNKCIYKRECLFCFVVVVVQLETYDVKRFFHS